MNVWLHAAHPDGHHLWAGPYDSLDALIDGVLPLLPHVPASVVWDVREDTNP